MNEAKTLKIHDTIGVGFGPSNLALAIALDDKKKHHHNLDILFIEKQLDYRWHGGTITDNSYLQISFLKDLVSLRDPTSTYTFINYLKSKGRLADFINLSTFYPSRLEFNDYLCWVAKQFAHYCCYGEEFFAVEPVIDSGYIDLLRVLSHDTNGNEVIRLTRSLVLGTGGHPRIPKIFKSLENDTRIFHSAHYLQSMRNQKNLKSIAIIGGGQSAAETFVDINDRYPSAKVDLIIRGSSLKPADSSPFVNEIFSPDFTDFIFNKTDLDRNKNLREYRHTNYSVIDLPMIEKIYDLLYKQKITGDIRYRYRTDCVIENVDAGPEHIALHIKNTLSGQINIDAYDCVVLATGYERNNHRKLLANISKYTHDFATDRQYRLKCDTRFRAPVYLQGYCEHSHGLSDTLLSILAIRSGEIASALAKSLGKVDQGSKTERDNYTKYLKKA